MITLFKKLFGINNSRNETNEDSEDESRESLASPTIIANNNPQQSAPEICLTKDELEDMYHLPLEVEEEELEAIEEPEEIKEIPKTPPPVTKKSELKIKFIDKVDLKLELQHHHEDEEVEEVIPEAPVKPGSLYDPLLDLSNYKYPVLDLLDSHGGEKIVHDPNELEANKNQIIATLKNYDIEIQRIAATAGPTLTLYEIILGPGVRISRIKNLEDDIALSLAAPGIRIIAPIPGKGTIGIELPNTSKSIVGIKTLLTSDAYQNNTFLLPIAMGRMMNNENFIFDLTKIPHLLIGGATGQGKSVCINSIIISLLFKKQ